MYRRIARGSSSREYTIFNPHGSTPLVPNPLTVVTVIDPGLTNAAIRQATRDKSGRVTTNMQVSVNFTHETLEFKGVGSETSHYTAVCKIIDMYAEYFRYSHYILIESQLRLNPDMVRLSQHIITHLMNLTKDKGLRPLIIEVAPQLKTKYLGCPPKLSKPQYKKWCKEKAIEILRSRGDIQTANMIGDLKKGDDHGDVVCYEAVWWMFLDGHVGDKPPIPVN